MVIVKVVIVEEVDEGRLAMHKTLPDPIAALARRCVEHANVMKSVNMVYRHLIAVTVRWRAPEHFELQKLQVRDNYSDALPISYAALQLVWVIINVTPSAGTRVMLRCSRYMKPK